MKQQDIFHYHHYVIHGFGGRNKNTSVHINTIVCLWDLILFKDVTVERIWEKFGMNIAYYQELTLAYYSHSSHSNETTGRRL